jgi:hypothetical protein
VTSATAGSCMVAGAESPGDRRSNRLVDACCCWANDRLAIDMNRAESIEETGDLPRLSGGEAMAELKKPRPHNPAAATYISR